MDLKEQLLAGALPQHVAIIMDGNGRWASKQGEIRLHGHRNAITSVREAAEGCAELGIGYLTLYAFSTENWGRPQNEVNGLMELLVATIASEMGTLMDNGIRLHTIGHTTGLPASCQAELARAMEQTAGNSRMVLTLALNYSGRWEITEAARQLAAKAAAGLLNPADIDENTIASHLATHNMPDPELLIRTSGELRISNFLLWQLAYTELYITPVLWPDFRRTDLHQALRAYLQRERRFGKVLEQQ